MIPALLVAASIAFTAPLYRAPDGCEPDTVRLSGVLTIEVERWRVQWPPWAPWMGSFHAYRRAYLLPGQRDTLTVPGGCFYRLRVTQEGREPSCWAFVVVW